MVVLSEWLYAEVSLAAGARARRLIPRRRSGRSMWLRARSISRRDIRWARLLIFRPAGNAPRASDISWRCGIGGHATFGGILSPRAGADRASERGLEDRTICTSAGRNRIPLIWRRLPTHDKDRALHPSFARRGLSAPDLSRRKTIRGAHRIGADAAAGATVIGGPCDLARSPAGPVCRFKLSAQLIKPT